MANRIYSKGGTVGITSLLSGQRVSKCSPRVDAYGVIDELQANIGLFVAACSDFGMIAVLRMVQADLLTASAELSMGQDANLDRLHKRVTQREVTSLEMAIDRYAELFPMPRHFVLPGCCLESAQAHVARTVCRRAERKVCILGNDPALALVSQYLNRLSDLLFTMAWGLDLLDLVKQALGLEPRAREPVQ